MRDYRNPFRSRTSEQQQQQGLYRFLRTYGSDVLDLLPEDLWDRPVIVRSAPGGGKTSLLRAFTIEAVEAVRERPDEFEELHDRYLELGVLDKEGPTVIGARLSLAQGFRDLMDLGADPEASRKLFFRMMDAQIVRSVCEASLTFAGLKFPDDLDQLQFRAQGRPLESLERLGGPNGVELCLNARDTEHEIRALLDSVLPISWDRAVGHGFLYSLKAFTGTELSIGGIEFGVKPLVMFDDGQELAPEQRKALLEALTDRELSSPRWWYTERHSALAPDEVIGDGEPGRSHHIVPLESRARVMGGTIRNGRRLRPFESMLIDVADRRARKPLADYADEIDNSFAELLDGEHPRHLDELSADAIAVVRQRVLSMSSGKDRYSEWVAAADLLSGHDAALRWRELEIVMTRDRDRTQLELLDVVLSNDDLKNQSAANIREAAALFLRQEFKVPYYFGSQRVSRLGSQNVEQYLVLSGNLFEEMLGLITLRKRPWLLPASQDRLVRSASEAMWHGIPQRRSYGRDIQHLLLRIAVMARGETYRAKAPYAPGVTGTALSMRDRSRLLDPEVRRKLPGAEPLFRALASAIGHNLLSADLNRSVKNDRWMVLYLNRMLCARFNLPIGYGGFKERSLEAMCAWMAEPVPGDLSGVEIPTLFED